METKRSENNNMTKKTFDVVALISIVIHILLYDDTSAWIIQLYSHYIIAHAVALIALRVWLFRKD